MAEPLVRKVFIIGGQTDEGKSPHAELNKLNIRCHDLGKILANNNIELVACSPFADSADYYTILGYSEAKKRGKVHLHFPNRPDVLAELKTLKTDMGENCPDIVPYLQPGYEVEEARSMSWLFCQLQALEKADMVIAIGGKTSKSANMLLHMAEIRAIPVLPFTFSGGAAKSYFERINWSARYPNVKVVDLQTQKGIDRVIRTIHDIKKGAFLEGVLKITKDSKIFISRARTDEGIAAELKTSLQNSGFTVLLGDEALTSERTVLPAISEYLNISQLYVIIWSVHYALSPWCYDELQMAIERTEAGMAETVLFNIDNSAIIPTGARTLKTMIETKRVETMLDMISEMINSKKL